MLGLQHSDIMMGKMDDMGPLFAQPTEQHMATGGGKRKPEDGGTMQHQGEQDVTPHPTCPQCVFLAYTFLLSTTRKSLKHRIHFLKLRYRQVFLLLYTRI
jgi:hypothetical protein